MEQTKYDVFISYSRKDYVKDDVEIPNNPITAIMDCFDQNGVSYWVDKKGIYSGQKFIEVISEAINSSKMLVFVSSKNSNESRWTANEIFEAYDEDKLIIPFRIDETPYNKTFKLIVRPFDFIEYYSHPNTALEDLIRAINKEKEKIRKEEQKQQETQRIGKVKQELIADIKEFQRLNGEQDFLLRSIYSKSKDVGAKTKKCPVCDAEMFVDTPYCESCGWHFASLFGVYGVDGKSLHDEKQLRVVRGLWQELREGKDSKARLEEIAANLDKERKEKEMYAEQCNKLKETAHSLAREKEDRQIRLMEMENRARRIEQQYVELKLRMEEVEKRKFAEEKREAEEKRLAEEQKREAERKAEEEQKCRDAEQRTKEMTFTVGGVSFKMIRVEGGSFMMGSPHSDTGAWDDEKPQHRVTLSDYYIGETQVTQALWKAVMGDNPSKCKGDTLPVQSVSWEDCQEFIKELNKMTGKTFRLPTEAEWEFAARGGRKSQGYKYAGSNDIDKVAWYDGNSESKTHPVKQKNANELGLYDMSGNVWEWCQDWSGNYSRSAQSNPMGPSTGSDRVIRGSGWEDSARSCRVAARYYGGPDNHDCHYGFRLSLVP